jgi:anti-sigma B factor antagonist
MDEPFALTEEERSDGIAVVAVQGAIDLFTAPEFKDGLLAVIDRGRHRIVLDLGETSFMDSSALAVLVSTRKHLAGQRGRLVIAGLNDNLAATFRLSGLDQLFTLEPTRERALAVLDDS